MPGYQPPFSLSPDLDLNKEDTPLIDVVVYWALITLSSPTRFCPLPHQSFEKNAQDPAWILEPWIQDPKDACRFSWTLITPSKKNCQIKHYSMDNQA